MDKMTSKEDAINLVKDVFRGMGGTVLPPRRPGHLDKYAIITPERDAFMMDFENTCLEQNWDSSKRLHPNGPNRYKDPDWAAMIQLQTYPHHSDVDWEEYCEFCEKGGDEWFLEDEDEPEVKEEKRQYIRDTRCSGCGRDDDFCRCGGGEDNSIWWGR